MSETKKQLLKSRLQRRMRICGIGSYSGYHDYVVAHPDEVEFFVNSVTTNKTDFYRENHHFEFVTSHVVPEAVNRAEAMPGNNALKIWHAGCSTGEEPYTLAIVLKEAQAAYPGLHFAQLASDIDTEVLRTAETGIYAEERVRTLPTQTLRQWFLRGKGQRAGSYRIKPELQGQLTFRQINLLDEPWPMKESTKFDVIFCRNVLIYFDKPTQNRLFERFHERLNAGGYLFLGHSESMHGQDSRFRSIGKTIYRALPHQSASKGLVRSAA